REEFGGVLRGRDRVDRQLPQVRILAVGRVRHTLVHPQRTGQGYPRHAPRGGRIQQVEQRGNTGAHERRPRTRRARGRGGPVHDPADPVPVTGPPQRGQIGGTCLPPPPHVPPNP